MLLPNIKPIPVTKTIHTSTVLRELIEGTATVEHFSLEWLISHIPENTFGFIFLFLALLSFIPIIDFAARLIILLLLYQVILGYNSPALPRRFLVRNLPVRYLTYINRHAIPVLVFFEKAVRPRWSPFLQGARYATAFITFLLTILSLVLPIPFSNIPAAIATALFAFAYIEHDGLLLLVALSFAISMLIIFILPLLFTMGLMFK